MAQAEAEREVQTQKALAVEKQQEAQVLVPARADRQAVEIRAEAERKRIEIEAEGRRNQITISADAEAHATRKRAEAESESVQKRAMADAAALQAMKQAEAEGQKAQAESYRVKVLAEAEGEQAKLLAQAEGERAKLLAEAEGRRELAAASAAEGEINLRQFLIEQMLSAEVEKVRAMAEAMGGLGSNVRIVQFGGENGHSNGTGTGNTLMDMLMHIPEVSEVFRAKTEALSGEDFEKTMMRIAQLFTAIRTMDVNPSPSVGNTTAPTNTSIAPIISN
jgi:flotillin